MKARKNLLSALLGAALLAMPITAPAYPHDGGHNRGSAPAYHQASASRPAFARQNFAPPVVANNRTWVAPASPIVPIHDHDDWRWRDRDGDGWRHHRDRDDWRWRNNYYRDRENCRIAPPSNPYANYYRQYPNSYRPGYYPQSYNYAPPSYGASGEPAYGAYGAPAGGGLAGMINQRNNADILYQQAVRNGNRVRAKHLGNDIEQLNKNIANARTVMSARLLGLSSGFMVS